MNKEEKKLFRARLQELKVPSGYCGTLKKHILDETIGHMKSHDHHIFMQQILPVCIRGLMDRHVRTCILRLSRLFRRLCVKTWDPRDYEALKEDVAITLVLFEVNFPPVFFDNMTHLLVHLVDELDICGPVHCRWMYPIERYLSIMKRYVKNRARPEGCMAECYIQDQALGFATEYMGGFDSVSTRVWDANEDEGTSGEVLEGASSIVTLTCRNRDTAHRYVVMNTTCMRPWYRKWEEEQAEAEARNESVDPFHTWIRHLITLDTSEATSDPTVRALAIPPKVKCRSFKSLRAFGNHYRVFSNKTIHTSFDSGIASAFMDPGNDNESGPVCRFSYVGILTAILQLDYGMGNDDPVLMKGKWVRPQWTGRDRSMIFDDEGFLLANFGDMVADGCDPFVFPWQVEQVFFSPVDLDRPNGWQVVLRKEARSRRVLHDSADMMRGENWIFSALEPPLRLETIIPRVQETGNDMVTAEQLAADAHDVPLVPEEV